MFKKFILLGTVIALSSCTYVPSVRSPLYYKDAPVKAAPVIHKHKTAVS